jgi:uncharacterized protein (TIGR03437 family)
VRRLARRIACLTLAAATFTSVSSAYYHFIHFASRTAPWRALYEKYDLNVLPNKTLTYFITDQTGVQLAPGDTYVGLISQIRSAGKVWNDVDTSDLRLAFGGFAAPNTPQSAPSLEIIFDGDVPPGLVAMGGPTVRADANDQFVPILKSVVRLRPDLRTKPSFSETFFGTLVHEIGHGLGLQHTFTSSVMSTSYTRSTSRSRPLTGDDVAGISLLYPSKDFGQTTGSISGRVTLSGSGVNLASVVAISPSGAAISTLTNPDGTYRIDGLPQRPYFVYVHPLPPARPGQTSPGDIVGPKDSEERSLGPGAPFETIFYPGTNDATRALTVTPFPGGNVENVNFTVRARNGYAIHSVETYAFPGDFAVKPPYLNPNISNPFIVATGSGLVSGNGPVSGLTVSVLGGATLGVKPYSPAPSSYVQIDFDVRTLSISADSPRHLVFRQNNDIYVLPAAFFQVEKSPPTITSVIPVADGAQRLTTITGTDLTEASRVFFDGVAVTVRDFDALAGRLTVVPPVAPANHRASVVVLNPDGQSSLFLQGDTPSTYTYAGEAPVLASPSNTLTVTPSSLPAGTEAMLQIDTQGGTFVEGQTSVGFGNSDILVRQISVVSPTRLLVNVAISPGAQAGSAQLSVVSGLQLMAQQFAFQVVTPAKAFWLSSNIVNAQTSVPSVSPGNTAMLTVGSGPATLSGSNVSLFLNDRSIPISSVTGNQMTFNVPAATAPGAYVLRLEATGERSLPILMIVDPPPPKILSAAADSGDNSSTLKAGQLIAVRVSDSESVGSTLDLSRVEVRLAGVEVKVAQILEQQDLHKLLVYVPDNAPTGSDVPLTVSIDSRTSDPLTVAVEN